MKNILIPIDFSQHSLSAARTGCFVAKKCQATVHLVHIVKAPEDWEVLSQAQQEQNTEIQNKILDGEQRLSDFSGLALFDEITVIPRVYEVCLTKLFWTMQPTTKLI